MKQQQMKTGTFRSLHKNLTEARLEYIVRSGFSGQIFPNYNNEGIPAVVKGYSDLDRTQEYSYNSFGYRCGEFEKTPFFLCSGDSNTFGVGLPEESTWPHMLSKKVGSLSQPVNLALPGASVESIVDDVFHYIKTYGRPKNLFIVFPDFARGSFFANPDVLVSRKEDREAAPVNVLTSHLIGKDLERPSISKKPHLIEDVISLEHIYFSSFRQIRHLEDFCSLANINFKWSVWSDDLDTNLIEKYNLNIALKPHPNQNITSKKIVDKLKRKYYYLNWIDERIPNHILFSSGMKLGISVYGTVLSELAFKNIIPICCGDNPAINYDFIFNAKTKEEYVDYIINYNKLIFKDNRLDEIGEFVYMNHIN